MLMICLTFVIATPNGRPGFTPSRDDGKCGQDVLFAVCKQGNCCSSSGWCGASDAHCKSSCAYQCDGNAPISNPGGPNPKPEGNVRSDSRCGVGWSNAPCNPADCCSSQGWCGGSSLHCGTGCQKAFGKCV